MTTCKSAPASARGFSTSARAPGVFATSRRHKEILFTVTAIRNPPFDPEL
jgi:hypothetical protein